MSKTVNQFRGSGRWNPYLNHSGHVNCGQWTPENLLPGFELYAASHCQVCGVGLCQIGGINGDGLCHKHTTAETQLCAEAIKGLER